MPEEHIVSASIDIRVDKSLQAVERLNSAIGALEQRMADLGSHITEAGAASSAEKLNKSLNSTVASYTRAASAAQKYGREVEKNRVRLTDMMRGVSKSKTKLATLASGFKRASSAVERFANGLRVMNTEGVGWWSRFGSVAVGFALAYRAINAAENALYGFFETVKSGIALSGDLAATQAKMATWAMMFGSNAETWSEAFQLAKTNVAAFAAEIPNAISPVDELSQALDELAQHGVIATKENMSDMVAFADFISMIATTTGSSVKQIRQEIQSLFEGIARPGNTLLYMLKKLGATQPEITQLVKSLKEGGDTTAKLERLMVSFIPYVDKMRDAMRKADPSLAFQKWKDGLKLLIMHSTDLAGKMDGLSDSSNIFGDIINRHVKHVLEMADANEDWAMAIQTTAHALDGLLTFAEKFFVNIPKWVNAAEQLFEDLMGSQTANNIMGVVVGVIALEGAFSLLYKTLKKFASVRWLLALLTTPVGAVTGGALAGLFYAAQKVNDVAGQIPDVRVAYERLAEEDKRLKDIAESIWRKSGGEAAHDYGRMADDVETTYKALQEYARRFPEVANTVQEAINKAVGSGGGLLSEEKEKFDQFIGWIKGRVEDLNNIATAPAAVGKGSFLQPETFAEMADQASYAGESFGEVTNELRGYRGQVKPAANETEALAKKVTQAATSFDKLSKSLALEGMSGLDAKLAKIHDHFESVRKSAEKAYKEASGKVSKEELESAIKLADRLEAIAKQKEINSEIDKINLALMSEQDRRVAAIVDRWEELEQTIIDVGNQQGWTQEQINDTIAKADAEMNYQIHELTQVNQKAAETVAEGWINAYNNITNALADALSEGKNLIQSFVDWVKQALAQLFAKQLVGSIAVALGLPGAAAWAGQGGGLGNVASGVSGLFSGIQAAGGIGSWLMSGLTNTGNMLMNAPSQLWGALFGGTGATDYTGYGIAAASEAELFNGMPSWLTGAGGAGLTAGIGSFIMNGLLNGDWANAAVSGATTGLGAWGGATLGAMTAVGGPIGAVVGGLVGALGGSFLGGLFGDGTERTYLQQAMTTSYGPGGFKWGEPRTRRWDRGEPDWMDQILDIQDKLEDQLKGLFDGVVDTLSKLTPNLKENLKSWSSDFLFSWSAETKDEVQEDLEKNIQNFAKYDIKPVIDMFKWELKDGLSGLDMSVFTEDFKKGFTEHIQQLMDQLDFSNIDSIEELEQALKDLGATVDEIDQMEEYVQKVYDIQKEFQDSLEPLDEYHKQLAEVNNKFEETRQSLIAMGVDLEKFPELELAWKDAILDISESIYGYVMALPDEINEHWDAVVRDMMGMNIAQSFVDMLNKVMRSEMDLEDVGAEWSAQIQKGMKDAVLSEFVDFGMDQIKGAFIAPFAEQLLGGGWDAEGLSQAFSAIAGMGSDLELAGQGFAEIVNYIQTTGNVPNQEWLQNWEQTYGHVWEKINEANAERERRAEDQAQAIIDAAQNTADAATSMNQAAGALDASAGSLDGAAGSLSAAAMAMPTDITVTVEQEVVNGG